MTSLLLSNWGLDPEESVRSNINIYQILNLTFQIIANCLSYAPTPLFIRKLLEPRIK